LENLQAVNDFRAAALPVQRCRSMSDIADHLRARTFQYALDILQFCRALSAEWYVREVGRQLLRAGMGVSGNYWSACRGRSHREFTSRLAVAVDESEESVLWLSALILSGIRIDNAARVLLAERKEIRAVLSTSLQTARENRSKRRTSSGQERSGESAIREFTKSGRREFTKTTIEDSP
jgi:four helix bundle protein